MHIINGGGEPNDCCQNRNYNDSVFGKVGGEIILMDMQIDL